MTAIFTTLLPSLLPPNFTQLSSPPSSTLVAHNSTPFLSPPHILVLPNAPSLCRLLLFSHNFPSAFPSLLTWSFTQLPYPLRPQFLSFTQPPYPSLIPRPCTFVVCSMKFTQRAWARSSRDAYHRRHFMSHQISQSHCVVEITTMELEEPGTGHARTIDYNSQLELKKTRSRNPGST